MARIDIQRFLEEKGYKKVRATTVVLSMNKFIDGGNIELYVEILSRGGKYIPTIVGGRFIKLDSIGFNFNIPSYKFQIKLGLIKDGAKSLDFYISTEGEELLKNTLDKYIYRLEVDFDSIKEILNRIKSNDQRYVDYSLMINNYYIDYGLLFKFNRENGLGNKFINLELSNEIESGNWTEDSKYVRFRRALIKEENLTPERYKELKKEILEVK